jgi:hypothetical protein
MGDTPDRGTEDLDTTPPLPFLEGFDTGPPGPDPEPVREPGPDPEPEDWEPPSREQWETEQARIAAAEDNAKAAREQVEQSNVLMRELLGSQRTAASEPEPEEPGPMPDPVGDADGFAGWLTKRDKHAEAKFNRQLRVIQGDIHQNARANDLFAEFVAQYPAMADKRDLVEFVSRRAGLTPHDPKEKIFQKVLDGLTGLGISVEPQPSGDPPPRSPRGGGGRTAGLGGGSSARRRPRAEPKEEVKDLIDQIAEDQVRMGVY